MSGDVQKRITQLVLSVLKHSSDQEQSGIVVSCSDLSAFSVCF